MNPTANLPIVSDVVVISRLFIGCLFRFGRSVYLYVMQAAPERDPLWLVYWNRLRGSNGPKGILSPSGIAPCWFRCSGVVITGWLARCRLLLPFLTHDLDNLGVTQNVTPSAALAFLLAHTLRNHAVIAVLVWVII